MALGSSGIDMGPSRSVEDRNSHEKTKSAFFQYFLVYDESARTNEKTIMSTDRPRTSPRAHRVVSQTSGVVVPAHRTLGRRGGTQFARRKQKHE